MRCPVLPAVRGLPHVLRGRVEHVRIDRREDDRERPLDALRRARSTARRRRCADTAPLRAISPVRRFSALEERAVVAAGEEDVRVLRIGRDVGRLRAADAVRIRTAGAAAATAAAAAAAAPPGEARRARHADRAAVLLRAAHVVRQVRRRDHVVELRRRVVARAPRAGGVSAL